MAEDGIIARRSPAQLLSRLDGVLAARFPTHPFEAGVDKDNFEVVMREYAAMSIAFPFVQAGAAYENYKRSVATRGGPDANSKITAAIGAFLVWDELGGHELVLGEGAAGLLKLTDVDRNFHSALLLKDVEQLLGHRLADARPGPVTQAYLEYLHAGLSADENQQNVAHMVAFEKHAMAMITALWGAICDLFNVTKDDDLRYFHAHIGTDSAGEAVHVQMTEAMVAQLVPEDQADRFLDLCVEAYGHNIQWCANLVADSSDLGREAMVA